ncbi:MAG: hypothetical protein ACREA4_10795, partial [Nitrososphaera sp.]
FHPTRVTLPINLLLLLGVNSSDAAGGNYQFLASVKRQPVQEECLFDLSVITGRIYNTHPRFEQSDGT